MRTARAAVGNRALHNQAAAVGNFRAGATAGTGLFMAQADACRVAWMGPDQGGPL